MSVGPVVTVAVPSREQACFLGEALDSLLAQELPTEIFVADAASRDGSVELIRSRAHRLAGWRSHADAGQAAAINECIARGSAPFVCWLNSDDLLLPGALDALVRALASSPDSPAVYARAWTQLPSGRRRPVWVEPFDERRLALRCIVSQPATLIRRSAWEAVGGLDESLHMAMDYDLWWRLHRCGGPLLFLDAFTAVNREHAGTKTRLNRALHYREAIRTVRKYRGRVPLKWWLYQPWSVWGRAALARFGRTA
ncbi:MAG: glycosyltransferase [Gammaproteobacteria bacterium]